VLLSSIPFGTAAVAALLVGHSSEKRQERRMHVGLPLLLGGCAFMLLPLMLQLHSHVPAFLMVTAAVVAADATTGPFWVGSCRGVCTTYASYTCCTVLHLKPVLWLNECSQQHGAPLLRRHAYLVVIYALAHAAVLRCSSVTLAAAAYIPLTRHIHVFVM
jgi:hypothetical protein